MRTYLLLIGSLFVANLCQAASFDINAHSDAVRLTFSKNTQRSVVGDAGILFFDRYSGSYNRHNRYYEDNEVALHAGLHLVDKNLRFGLRGFSTSVGDEDVLAVGFGGQGNMSLNRDVSLSGHFYYAPDATSLLDSEGYRELELRVNLRLNNDAYIYLGYRSIEVDIGGYWDDIELDDDLHVGCKLYF